VWAFRSVSWGDEGAESTAIQDYVYTRYETVEGCGVPQSLLPFGQTSFLSRARVIQRRTTSSVTGACVFEERSSSRTNTLPS